MADKTEKELDRRIEALLRSRRPRGRPRNGFEKAVKYADEVYKLRFAGRSSWHAIVEAAENYRKTPQHIAACVKEVNETDPREYLYDEPDYTEDPDYGERS